MFTTQPESNNLATCFFFQKTCEHEAKRKRKNKSNSKKTCDKTCDKNAEKTPGRTQQLNKVKDNISQNMQVFVSHLFVIPAFSSFFFSNFPQFCGKQAKKNNKTRKCLQNTRFCAFAISQKFISCETSFKSGKLKL